ncbi:MAG: cls [Devosia sp.]|uniref:cardiolipin synthase n=1 Tax=Devosia sp. TaxID=1871048 RepID=UPI002638AB9E|nr:cardiolipin synthase [Devosia sp.]MDB5540143.1 cls [Devosia sp.]
MTDMTELVENVVRNFSIIALVVGGFYLLAFVCAVREISASRTSQGSIAWLVSLAFLPFPTAIIYLIFGWKHFDGYALTRMQVRQSRMLRSEDLAVIDREAGAAWPVQRRAAGMPFLAGNTAELLIDGEATFESIFEGIAIAKTYIFVQFYILRHDALGQRLAAALMERARAGVSIYVLYDDVGSGGLSKEYRDRLRAEGIQIFSFNYRHRFLRVFGPTRINYRNHRKTVVVDGKIAWTGGANVGVEYLGESKRFGHWRDTQLKLEGPAASSVALIFQEDWLWATGVALAPPPPEPVEEPGDVSALVMATGPADKLEACPIAFADIIGQAKERLWIVSPYFVPDTDMRTALYAAILRGVDVRIMLPTKPDHIMVWLASNAHADAMVEHDIAIYRYQKGFLHQKVLLMDDRMASVGTVNFDNRSFAINFEMTVWMPNRKVIDAVDKMLLTDIAKCRPVTKEEVQKRRRIPRFIAAAARLLSPIL